MTKSKKSKLSATSKRPKLAAAKKNVSAKAARMPGNPKFNNKASRPAPKTNNPEIQVKKSTYSKSLRGAVLASPDARQRLIEMGGENTISIIRDFDSDMSDEELARRTNIKASDVRVVLNRLHSQGLFSYTRVRDRDSGWYSYIWKMSENRLKEFSEEAKEVEVGEQTVDSGGDRYRCLRCSPDDAVGFDQAMDAQFKCGKCGNELEFLERKKR